MAITSESKKALQRRIGRMNHEIAMLDDHRYKIQRRVNKEQKKIDAINAKMTKLQSDKAKIQGDIV